MYFGKERGWMQPPEPVAESQILSTERADIVIVGAGHSGVLCARSAAEEGQRVILLEKSKKEYLNVIGHEIGTFNSRFVQEHGVPEYDPIDMILEYQKRSLNRCNTGLIRQYAYHSGETFDWFIDALDPKYKESVHIFMNPAPAHFEGDINGYKNFIGTVIFNKKVRELGLAQAIKDTIGLFEKAGGKTYYDTAACYLEKDGSRVTAVIAKEGSGAYRRYIAEKGVVLAAGDFSANLDMVTDLLDEFSELSENTQKYKVPRMGRDGSGIRMGIWAGGHIQPAPRGGMYSNVVGRAGYMGGAAFLKLNAHGKRYTNEGIMGFWGVGLQGARQPEGDLYSIWDGAWREELEYQAIDHLGVDLSDEAFMANLNEAIENAVACMPDGYESFPGAPGSRMSGTVQKKRTMPSSWNYTIYAANTIEELADNLGFTGEYKQNFLNSVKRYNELCEKGRDEDFAKDPRLLHALKTPPFFATPTKKDAGMLMVSLAGLVVDENQQVLDDALLPIPGLYATGNCAGALFPVQYSTPVGGSSLGLCHALGRALGLHLASL